LIYFATEESEHGEDVSTVLFNELYETRTGDGNAEADGDEDMVTNFDEHVADIEVLGSKGSSSTPSQAKQVSRKMSPFLRELLSVR
jgi:hypothetical protein